VQNSSKSVQRFSNLSTRTDGETHFSCSLFNENLKRMWRWKITAFWALTSCTFVDSDQCFGENYYCSLQGRQGSRVCESGTSVTNGKDASLLCYHEDGGYRLFLNFGNCLPNYTTSHSRIITVTAVDHQVWDVDKRVWESGLRKHIGCIYASEYRRC
jgi:hypothetical protein